MFALFDRFFVFVLFHFLNPFGLKKHTTTQCNTMESPFLFLSCFTCNIVVDIHLTVDFAGTVVAVEGNLAVAYFYLRWMGQRH